MKRTFNERLHLYLTGYRGCGKSTVAKLLAGRLQRAVVDLDEVIETDAKMTIAEIFASENETGFRNRETESLLRIALAPAQVISLGGGAILREENRRTIRHTGVCIWLDADPEVIAARLSSDSTTGDRRPSLTGQPVLQEIHDVMAQRETLYREAADLRIDTSGLSIETVVDQIVAAVVPNGGSI
ncbi:shikimate kinase AroL [Neorhodopirellula pilleata]|uniref:Shikimate kinase n=1 Tax=Neorhodopirellula pilleata TaxID=2714738 RepID=A0A5C6ALB3_9BACT|nr:shikimate kinase AroL [Neorhodopirellula pilleata]TWT98963.1 Shikimate kinase 2 [Neorhodopirellula pilleata]